MRAVTLEAKLLQGGAAQLAGAALDRPHDVVLRHVDFARLFHRQPELVVPIRVSPAFASGDGDLSRHLGELLTFLGVGQGLLVLDRRPLGMS